MRMSKVAVHPTREKLIMTMVEMLDGPDPEHVTVEHVLAESGVSRGSLYHHFEDFEELYEVGMTYRITQWVNATVDALDQVFLTATSREDIRAGVRAVTDASQNPDRRLNRLERARAFGLAGFNPRFQSTLGVEQARLTESLRGLIEGAQQKGWIRADLDPMAGAVFIQAYTLGRVVDDISIEKVDPDKWKNLIHQVIDALIFDEA